MATTRNSSIEMLRLFAIFGIVIMHVNGPLLSEAFGINSIWIQIENSIFNCGVSVFVLISGYFGIRRSSFKILLLELSALFYSLVASLLTLFVSGGGYSQLIKALLPFSTNEFWFFTCYLLILLFSPYLNEFVDSSSQQQFKKLLTALCLVFVLLPSVLYFHPLGSGKNILNLVFVYLLGGLSASLQRRRQGVRYSFMRHFPRFIYFDIYLRLNSKQANGFYSHSLCA